MGMMKMRKSIKIRVMCLVMAGTMLAGSLVFAAVNGSPYETLKNAIFDALFYDNVTIAGHMTLTVNGEVEHIDRTHIVIGETGRLEHFFDRDGQPTGRFSYNSDNIRITSNIFTDVDDAQWYSAWVSDSTFTNSHMGLMPFWERGSAAFRFMELFIDLVVGDLRNNMTMSTNGGIRSVTGTITHSQLPQLVLIGLDVIIEGSQGSNDPLQTITLNRLHGNADIDADGNLLHLSGRADITIVHASGDVNVYEFEFKMNFTDIGTSNPQSPIPGAEELLARFVGGPWLYFTRNADGSINTDSITTRWPGR